MKVESETRPHARAKKNPREEQGGSDASQWPSERSENVLQEQWLEKVRTVAKLCQTVNREFSSAPPPDLETLISLCRVILFEISTRWNIETENVRLLTALMKPVMDWARLQEQRKDRELAEAKYRDQKAATERELNAEKNGGGLQPERAD